MFKCWREKELNISSETHNGWDQMEDQLMNIPEKKLNVCEKGVLFHFALILFKHKYMRAASMKI